MQKNSREKEKRETAVVNNKRELIINFSATEVFHEIDYNLKISIRKGISKTLEYENFPYPAEVSVTLCDEEYIHSLNLQYRGVDKPTDVLSFPLYDNGKFPPDECLICATLGDIVISVPRAREQAHQIGHSFLREVVFLAVHSTLHLLGYDHERSDDEDKLQCRIQKEIIKSLDI